MTRQVAPGRGRWLILIGAMLLAACQAVPSLGLAPLDELPLAQAASTQVSASIPGGRRKPFFEDRGVATGRPAGVPELPAAVAAQGGEVSLNFVDTDIREIARVILGSTLKVPYTIDANVRGTATLDTGTPMPRTELLPMLEILLNQNGATLVKRANLYAVVPIGTAAAANVLSGATGAGSQVVALQYASAKDLAKLLEPYVTDGSKVASDPTRNALIVSGDQAARQTLTGLIRAFDIDVLAGQSFAIFPTEGGDTAKMATALEKALRAESEGALAGLVRVIALPRVNGVLVASSQPRYLDAAKRLFRLTGQADEATKRIWHVYHVQNGQSADLENLLQRAFTPRNVTSTAPGGTGPGADTARMGLGLGLGLGRSTGTGAGTAGATGGPVARAGLSGLAALTGPVNANAPAGQAATSPATEPLSAETGAAGAEDENRIRIIGNRRNNALLIFATPSEYSVIEGMLHKIDITPLQVMIEATIAEITLNDTLQYGTQFFFKLDHVAENLGAIPAFPPGPISPTGLIGFALSKQPHFILRALSDVTKVKVLSSPQILVMDNEPAQLQVGQQVPILTSTATSTLAAGAPIVNSIDYHPTGVIMQVTPRINASGLVTLDVAQEVSDVAAPAANTATGSPTFDDRLVRTRVAVQNGQTVALAGLIRDNASDDNNGIPFLKDVPVLSTFLSSQTSTRTRTELLVLITPRVVHNQRDARALTEDLRRQLNNAALVPAELSRKPIRGLANPHGL
jgi:general secretion pathway protein D